MSWVSSWINSAVKSIENSEKSTVIDATKDEIESIIDAKGAKTEADAIAAVNSEIDTLVNNVIGKINSPIFQALIAIERGPVEAWIEGIADGAVSEVFAKVVGQIEGTKAGQAFANPLDSTEAVPVTG